MSDIVEALFVTAGTGHVEGEQALENAPWIAERLRQMDMSWRDHVPDPWNKHIIRFRDLPDWMGIPVYLPLTTPPEIVVRRDKALGLSLDYWAIAHVQWRIRTNIPLRPGDPTSEEEVEALLAPIIPELKAATAAFRELWEPFYLDGRKRVARQRTIARSRPRHAAATVPREKTREEMSISEFIDSLFPD